MGKADTVDLVGSYLNLAGSPITVTGSATLSFTGDRDLRVQAGQTLRFENAVITNGNLGANYRGFEHRGTIVLVNTKLETNSMQALGSAVVKMDANSMLYGKNRMTFAAGATLEIDVTDLAADGVAKMIMQGGIDDCNNAAAKAVLTGEGAENTTVYADNGAVYIVKNDPAAAIDGESYDEELIPQA